MNGKLRDKELNLLIEALNCVGWAEEMYVPKQKTSQATATRIERKLKKALEHPDTEFE